MLEAIDGDRIHHSRIQNKLFKYRSQVLLEQDVHYQTDITDNIRNFVDPQSSSILLNTHVYKAQ